MAFNLPLLAVAHPTETGMLTFLHAYPLLLSASLLLIARSGHTGRLLQDVLGALIFLVAIVQSLLLQKPAAIKKGGFLSWLHNT